MRARDRRWLIGVSLRLALLLGLVSLVLTCSYGPRDRGVEPGYVRFSGDLSGVTVRVDGGKRFSLRETRDSTPGGKEAQEHETKTSAAQAFYRMRPGKHKISVYRDERLLISKRMFLPEQVVADVRVP